MNDNRYRMNVCTSLNDNYAKYTCVMLRSLFMNNPDAEVYVYLLQDSLSDISQGILRDTCDEFSNHLYVLNVDVDRIDTRIRTTANWGMETNFRLQMFDLLPDDIDRLLYLDVDMVIINSIKDLYQMDFKDKEIIASRDMPLTDEKIDDYKYSRHERFYDIIDRKEYFNAGMILFNMDKIRGAYDLNSFLHLAEDVDFKIYAPDQDLLNLLFDGKSEIVDPYRYDFFANVGIDRGYDYEKTKQSVAIVHFTGKKPWSGGDHIHFSIEKLWWDYALQTVYRDVFLEEYTLGSVSDETVREYIKGLLKEITVLKNDLNSAIESFNKLYSVINK